MNIAQIIFICRDEKRNFWFCEIKQGRSTHCAWVLLLLFRQQQIIKFATRPPHPCLKKLRGEGGRRPLATLAVVFQLRWEATNLFKPNSPFTSGLSGADACEY